MGKSQLHYIGLNDKLRCSYCGEECSKTHVCVTSRERELVDAARDIEPVVSAIFDHYAEAKDTGPVDKGKHKMVKRFAAALAEYSRTYGKPRG